MTKLLNIFLAAPTDANRAKLLKYLAKHPMAECLASADELAALKQHGLI